MAQYVSSDTLAAFKLKIERSDYNVQSAIDEALRQEIRDLQPQIAITSSWQTLRTVVTAGFFLFGRSDHAIVDFIRLLNQAGELPSTRPIDNPREPVHALLRAVLGQYNLTDLATDTYYNLWMNFAPSYSLNQTLSGIVRRVDKDDDIQGTDRLATADLFADDYDALVRISMLYRLYESLQREEIIADARRILYGLMDSFHERYEWISSWDTKAASVKLESAAIWLYGENNYQEALDAVMAVQANGDPLREQQLIGDTAADTIRQKHNGKAVKFGHNVVNSGLHTMFDHWLDRRRLRDDLPNDAYISLFQDFKKSEGVGKYAQTYVNEFLNGASTQEQVSFSKQLLKYAHQIEVAKLSGPELQRLVNGIKARMTQPSSPQSGPSSQDTVGDTDESISSDTTIALDDVRTNADTHSTVHTEANHDVGDEFGESSDDDQTDAAHSTYYSMSDSSFSTPHTATEELPRRVSELSNPDTENNTSNETQSTASQQSLQTLPPKSEQDGEDASSSEVKPAVNLTDSVIDHTAAADVNMDASRKRRIDLHEEIDKMLANPAPRSSSKPTLTLAVPGPADDHEPAATFIKRRKTPINNTNVSSQNPTRQQIADWARQASTQSDKTLADVTAELIAPPAVKNDDVIDVDKHDVPDVKPETKAEIQGDDDSVTDLDNHNIPDLEQGTKLEVHSDDDEVVQPYDEEEVIKIINELKTLAKQKSDAKRNRVADPRRQEQQAKSVQANLVELSAKLGLDIEQDGEISMPDIITQVDAESDRLSQLDDKQYKRTIQLLRRVSLDLTAVSRIVYFEQDTTNQQQQAASEASPSRRQYVYIDDSGDDVDDTKVNNETSVQSNSTSHVDAQQKNDVLNQLLQVIQDIMGPDARAAFKLNARTPGQTAELNKRLKYYKEKAQEALRNGNTELANAVAAIIQSVEQAEKNYNELVTVATNEQQAKQSNYDNWQAAAAESARHTNQINAQSAQIASLEQANAAVNAQLNAQSALGNQHIALNAKQSDLNAQQRYQEEAARQQKQHNAELDKFRAEITADYENKLQTFKAADVKLREEQTKTMQDLSEAKTEFEKQKLNEKIKQQDDAMSKQTKELEEAKVQLQRELLQVQASAKTIQDLQKDTAKKQQDAERLEQQVKELQSKVNNDNSKQLQQELATTQDKLTEANQRITKIEAELAAANSQLSDAVDKQLDEPTPAINISELEQRANDVEKQLDSIKQERDDLQQRCSMLKTALHVSFNAKEELGRQLDEERQQRQRVEIQKTVLERKQAINRTRQREYKTKAIIDTNVYDKRNLYYRYDTWQEIRRDQWLHNIESFTQL